LKVHHWNDGYSTDLYTTGGKWAGTYASNIRGCGLWLHFVEFKWKKGKKSPDQEATCNLLTSMGYEVLEWRTLQECIDWLMLQLGNTNEPLLDE